MDISFALIALGLLIFCSHIFSALFVKIRVPNVLLLMTIGLIIGPITHWVTPQDIGGFGSIFTTITLIAILFESGTNLDIADLRKSLLPALGLTVLNYALAMGVAIAIGRVFLHLPWVHAVYLGAALGGISPTVVIPMLGQLKPGPKVKTVLYLESALSGVLCLIIALALMDGIKTGSVSVKGIIANMGLSMLFAMALGVAMGGLWFFVLKKYLSNVKNTMFTTFALGFIIYGACDSLGLNGGLAILAYGVMVGNIEKTRSARKYFETKEEIALNEQEKNFYSEIVFILQTYFFVYIGISIQFSTTTHLLWGALFVALAFLLRPLGLLVLGRKKISKRDSYLVSILGPKGLVTAVLASLPLQYAQQTASLTPYPYSAQRQELLAAGETVQNVAYAVVFLSIVLCSLLVMLLGSKLTKLSSTT